MPKNLGPVYEIGCETRLDETCDKCGEGHKIHTLRRIVIDTRNNGARSSRVQIQEGCSNPDCSKSKTPDIFTTNIKNNLLA